MLEKHVCLGTGSPSRTRASPTPQGNTTFISEQLKLEPTPVCMLMLQENPKRCSGYFPKKPRVCDYTICPALTNLEFISKSNSPTWSVGASEHPDTSAAFTEEKAIPGTKCYQLSWAQQLVPYRRVPLLMGSSHLFKCDWNVAGAVSEGEDGVVPS